VHTKPENLTESRTVDTQPVCAAHPGHGGDAAVARRRPQAPRAAPGARAVRPSRRGPGPGRVRARRRRGTRAIPGAMERSRRDGAPAAARIRGRVPGAPRNGEGNAGSGEVGYCAG